MLGFLRTVRKPDGTDEDVVVDDDVLDDEEPAPAPLDPEPAA